MPAGRSHTEESSEDYLEAILETREARGTCRNVDISERMGVSKASVTRAVRLLRGRGLVDVVGHEIVLTERGEQLASSTLEKHRFFEALLVGAGVDLATASAEACHMEHCISDESFRMLRARLTGSRQAKKA